MKVEEDKVNDFIYHFKVLQFMIDFIWFKILIRWNSLNLFSW